MCHRSTTLARTLLRVAAAGMITAALASGASGQAAAESTTLPFGPGERATYQVKLGALSVGSGSLTVLGRETVNGHSTMKLQMRISGGIPLARVNDVYESWLDPAEMLSRRFRQDIHEVRYRRNRTYDFDPGRGTWRRNNGETGTLASNRPLDDLSFLYYARTLPLRVGETYRLNRYFKESGNPVVLQVLRRDTVRVPAGTFHTVVIRPVIQTDGLFGEDGQAEVYLTDDERRIPVLVRSRVSRIGSLTMNLQSYTPPAR
jgi:hypothetical protein